MTTRFLLAVAVGLVAGSVFAQTPVLTPPTPVPASAPMPGLTQLAHEVNPPVYGAETAGLPPPIPSVDPELPPPGTLVWGSAEYLFWWLRDSPIRVPLASLGMPSGTTELGNGLGDVGKFDGFNGGRVRLGAWFDGERSWGAEIGGFVFQDRSASAAVGADNSTINRIFFDANTGQPIVVPVNVPGLIEGTIAAAASMRFGGAEADVRAAIWTQPTCRIELSAGYRFLGLRESLSVLQESEVVVGAAVEAPGFGVLPEGALAHVFDKIETTNLYNGATIGAYGDWYCGALTLGLGGKVGVGAVDQEVRAGGATLLTNTASFAAPSGLFVQSSNSGTTSRVRASFEAEVEVTAAVQVISCVRIIAGWSGLWWTGVVRPGNQLDTVVNPALLPLGSGPHTGPARPTVPFNVSDFWANGFNVGVEIAY